MRLVFVWRWSEGMMTVVSSGLCGAAQSRGHSIHLARLADYEVVFDKNKRVSLQL